MNLLEQIKTEYDHMSKGQKRIAMFILQNYDKAAFSTAAKMGQAIGVSESSVVRFAYMMGFLGYPEMQAALQEIVRNKLTSTQRLNLLQDLSDADLLQAVLKADISNIRKLSETITLEDMDDISDRLLRAKTVYILGLRGSFPLAQVLQYYLNFIINDARMIAVTAGDVFEQMMHISSDDVLFGITFPRYSRRTVDAMRYAQKEKAYTIGLTDSMKSPICDFADKTLIAHNTMVSFADSLVAPLSVIDVLIAIVSRRNSDMVTKNLNQLESLWHSEGIYLEEESELSDNQ